MSQPTNSKARRALRVFIGLTALYVAGCTYLGIRLAKVSVQLQRLPLGDVSAYRSDIPQQFHTRVEDTTVTAADGVVLRAWFIQPPNSNGKAVIILHGVDANRVASSGFAEMFLRRGYSVLLPDSRDHGDSGGDIATYGVLEKEDVRRWAVWVQQRSPGCTYLYGSSMGAAIALQAATVTPQVCAVVAESSYAGFREVTYERIGRSSRLGTLFWKTAGRPIIEAGIAYTRLRYGIYLPDSDPEAAVKKSHVPTLLIAGTVDQEIPMHHAQELEKACPMHCALWIVQGADHGGASAVAHAEFERRVLEWFGEHNEPAK